MTWNEELAAVALAWAVMLSIAVPGMPPSLSPVFAEGEPAGLDAETAGLIEQLGHDEYGEREAAQGRLLDIGVPAEDAVRKALQHPDPEIRRRAGIILKQIKWHLPPEQRARLGDAMVEKIRKWESLGEKERMRLLIGCIWGLGDEADVLCLKVLRHEESPGILRRAARWFIENGREEHLQELFAIAQEKDNNDIRFAAGTLAMRVGRPKIAIDALAHVQKDMNLGLLFARLHEQDGNYRDAERLYTALHLFEKSNIHFALKQAEMMIKNGKRDQALKTLLKTCERDETAETHLTVVKALKEYSFDDEAGEIAARAGKRFEDYRFPYALARFAEKAGDASAASKHYFDALRLASRGFEICMVNESLAKVLMADEGVGPGRMLKDLRHKASQAEKDADFRAVVYLNLLLAQMASTHGRAEETKAACEIIMREHQKAAGLSFTDLPCTLGRMLERVQAWEAAAAIYQGAVDSGKARSRHIVALGKCYFKMSDKSAALGKWCLLVEGNRSKHPDNYALLIDTFLACKLSEAAGKAAEEGLQKHPKALNLVGRRLGMLLDAGDVSGAVQLITDTMMRYESSGRSAVAARIVRGLPETANLRALIRQVEKSIKEIKTRDK
jgi:tetratricopeptide (TPR) repeat protein